MIYEIEHTVMIDYVEKNGNRLKGGNVPKTGLCCTIYSHWYDNL